LRQKIRSKPVLSCNALKKAKRPPLKRSVPPPGWLHPQAPGVQKIIFEYLKNGLNPSAISSRMLFASKMKNYLLQDAFDQYRLILFGLIAVN